MQILFLLAVTCLDAVTVSLRAPPAAYARRLSTVSPDGSFGRFRSTER